MGVAAAGGRGRVRSIELTVHQTVPSGSCPGDRAIGRHRERPAAFVDQMVVGFAERDQVGQRRLAAVGEPDDVVDATVVEPDPAVRVGAGGMHRGERSALLPVGRAQRRAQCTHGAVGIDQDGIDDGLAAQALHG
jgi:hypothetical protein